jgi:hypothetical protein
MLMDLREIGWEDVDWINLAQNRDRWRPRNIFTVIVSVS